MFVSFFMIHIWMLIHRWPTSWENLFMQYANNKEADQPAHPRSLISTFIVRCLDSIIPLVFITEISSIYLASVAAQTDLRLTWSGNPKTGFLVTWLRSSCTRIYKAFLHEHAYKYCSHFLLCKTKRNKTNPTKRLHLGKLSKTKKAMTPKRSQPSSGVTLNFDPV